MVKKQQVLLPGSTGDNKDLAQQRKSIGGSRSKDEEHLILKLGKDHKGLPEQHEPSTSLDYQFLRPLEIALPRKDSKSGFSQSSHPLSRSSKTLLQHSRTSDRTDIEAQTGTPRQHNCLAACRTWFENKQKRIQLTGTVCAIVSGGLTLAAAAHSSVPLSVIGTCTTCLASWMAFTGQMPRACGTTSGQRASASSSIRNSDYAKRLGLC